MSNDFLRRQDRENTELFGQIYNFFTAFRIGESIDNKVFKLIVPAVMLTPATIIHHCTGTGIHKREQINFLA